MIKTPANVGVFHCQSYLPHRRFSMFTFLPKPIYEWITDYHLGGLLTILIGLFILWLFVQFIYLLRFLNKRTKILFAMHHGKEKIHIANPLWFFGAQKDKVDFYLVNGEKIFAIKILGAFRPGMEFCFVSKTEYHLQRHIILGPSMFMLACGYGKKKQLPNIDFTYQCDTFGIDQEKIIPVLLWNPAAYCISTRPTATKNAPSSTYHTGDVLYGKLLMDSHILKKICKDSNRAI